MFYVVPHTLFSQKNSYFSENNCKLYLTHDTFWVTIEYIFQLLPLFRKKIWDGIFHCSIIETIEMEKKKRLKSMT